jgi:glycosyltransferase involved in cell wall biosynthesis
MLSIIIPTRNRVSFLKEAIISVLEQDYFRRAGREQEFELLVIDDGSEDETRDVAMSFGGPVTYLRQPHRGVSAARNHGLQIARGEFIAFLDSDDLWKKEKIGVQMAFFKAFPSARISTTEEIWVRRGKRLNPGRKHRKPAGWIFDQILSLCLLSLSCCLFRREVFDVVGVFDETMPVCEDYDFSLRLARIYPVHLIGSPLVIKRGGHPDQLSHQYWGMDRFRVQALEKVLRLGVAPGQERLVKEEIVRKCRILSRGFEKRGREGEADRYLKLIRKYGAA